LENDLNLAIKTELSEQLNFGHGEKLRLLRPMESTSPA